MNGSPSKIRTMCHYLEADARRMVAVAKEVRKILDAPPDPKPRHRRNLLSWKIVDLKELVDNMQKSVATIEEEVNK